MAENLFTDFPERVEQIKKYSDLAGLALPLEDTFGEKGSFKTPEEAMELYLGVLEEMGRYTAKEVQPTAAEIDQQGSYLENGEVVMPEKLVQHLNRSGEMGVYSSSSSKKYGGLNMPRSIQLLTLEMFAHACPNTGLTVACLCMADFIQAYGTEEQKTRYMPKMMSGEWRTSMALTESGAGSDLGKLRTSARREGDRWVVNGTKQFITSGNGQITFALVRTDPQSTGLQGLSVLIVPRKIDGKDNYKITKLEDKICLHASPTCELIFENSLGELLGPENEGFKVMAELMNGARLAMGACALGLATSAMAEAKRYGAERVTMGKPIIQHPMVADMIFEMEIETRAMRAIVVEAGVACDWMGICHARGDDKGYKKWRKRYRRLTPLVKYYCSERSIVIAKNALQIFGGYGVCRDYPVERLMRETLIYPIYEGASQIQSLMVLKDTLKDVAQQATGFLGSLAGAWAESLVTRDPVKAKLLEARNELNQGIRTILMSIIKDKFRSDIDSLRQQKIQEFLRDFSLQLLSPKTDLTLPFLWAERFTKITCDYYALKCLADQRRSGDKESERWVLEFAELAIPRMKLENHYMQHRLPSTLDYMRSMTAAT